MSTHKSLPLAGIRREDKNPWEKRAPVTPAHVAAITKAGQVRFRVQPSPGRIFADAAYGQAGAEVDEDLSPCKVIFGVKEIPIKQLLAGKVYAYFAHVIKGQAYNMDMLSRLLELGCTLIDYEKVADEEGGA